MEAGGIQREGRDVWRKKVVGDSALSNSANAGRTDVSVCVFWGF